VSEELRDEYPNCFQMHNVVWPYSSGEVVVQSYNSILSLSHLHDTSDAILCLQNDQAHDVCVKLLGNPRPKFQDLNKIMAQGLASILMPSTPLSLIDSTASAAPNPSALSISQLLESVTPSPLHKLLTARTLPQVPKSSVAFTSNRWHTLSKLLRQMLVADSHLEEGLDWEVSEVLTNKH